jgi:hypothetical protein
MGLLFRGGAKQKARLCGPGFQVSFLGIDLYLFSFGGPANHNTCTLGMRTMRLFLMQAATLTEHGAKYVLAAAADKPCRVFSSDF